MSLPKHATSKRIYFQNVNGINPSQVGTWKDTCEHIRDMEIDTALIAEHKLDTNQSRVTKKLKDQAKETFGIGSFTINATSTSIASPTVYKPGG